MVWSQFTAEIEINNIGTKQHLIKGNMSTSWGAEPECQESAVKQKDTCL